MCQNFTITLLLCYALSSVVDPNGTPPEEVNKRENNFVTHCNTL